MFKKVRSHIGGNLVAYVALFFALAGGAYAASTVAAPNSVNSAAIINGQVKTPDLANGAVSAAKVAPNTFTKAITLNGDLLGPTSTTLLAADGLRLTASCTPASKPASLSVTAVSSSGGRFEINAVRSLASGSPTLIKNSYILGAGGSGTQVLADQFPNTTSDQIDAGGTFVYASQNGSPAVTGTFHYYVQNGGGECDFLGNAVPSP